MGRRTDTSKSLNRPRRPKSAGIRHTQHRNQNHSIKYRRQDFNPRKLDRDHERRVPRLRTRTTIQIAILGYDQPHQEQIDDVEDTDSPNDLFRSARDFFLGIRGFGGGEAGEFGAGIGEGGGDEDAAETVETVEEGGVW